MEMIAANSLFKTRGRPPSDPDDIAARRKAFQRLRRVLDMDRNELAAVTGLKPGTIGGIMSPSAPHVAATWATIDVMRREAITRAKAAVTAAEDRLFRAEIELQNLERGTGPAAILSDRNPPTEACASQVSGSAFS